MAWCVDCGVWCWWSSGLEYRIYRRNYEKAYSHGCEPETRTLMPAGLPCLVNELSPGPGLHKLCECETVCDLSPVTRPPVGVRPAGTATGVARFDFEQRPEHHGSRHRTRVWRVPIGMGLGGGAGGGPTLARLGESNDPNDDTTQTGQYCTPVIMSIIRRKEREVSSTWS